MSDHHLFDDEATLYVLGRLTEAERGEFEARLAESAELRALVRELAEGAVAVAMASPRRRAPQQVWSRIEKAVTEETSPRAISASFWFGWLRNGWATAAACLIGWLFYALWVNRAEPPIASPVQVVSDTNLQRGETSGDLPRMETGDLTPQPGITSKAGQLSKDNPPAQTKEIRVLRWQIVELKNHASELSQVLTQQQALLAEPSRAKFFQLVPTSEGSAGTNMAAPPPELQRALFVAMARELGWSRSADTTSDAKPNVVAETGQGAKSSHSNSTQTNQPGVDFVKMQPATNQTAPTVNSQPVTEVASGDTPPQTEVGSAESPLLAAIPGFVAGTNMFLALNSSVVHSGGQVTFWNGSPGQWSQPIGYVTVGNNSTVVTIPLASLNVLSLNTSGTFASAEEPSRQALFHSLFVTTTTAAGQSNGVPFSMPPAPPP
jgi:hypothetical protein